MVSCHYLGLNANRIDTIEKLGNFFYNPYGNTFNNKIDAK